LQHEPALLDRPLQATGYSAGVALLWYGKLDECGRLDAVA